MAETWSLERKIPLGVILALAVQSGGALAWAGGAAERIATLERRLDHQSNVNERLARLEAEAEGARASLARIEAKLDGGGGR